MSNFKTAVNELMSGKLKSDEPALESQKSPAPQQAAGGSKPEIRQPAPQPVPQPVAPQQAQAPAPQQAPVPTPAPAPQAGSSSDFSSGVATLVSSAPEPAAPEGGYESILSPDLVIEGTVKSKSDITLNGHIIGDITCGGQLRSSGAIDGDIESASVTLIGSTVNGNITVRDSISMDINSSVNGDITATSLFSNGKVTGSVILKEGISLQANASVIGNIKATSISVEPGTTVIGNMEIRAVEPAPAAQKPAAPAPVEEAPVQGETNPAQDAAMAELLAIKEALRESLNKK